LVLLATLLGELPKVAIDDLALLLVRQAFPPLVELAGSLGSPTHGRIITFTL